MILTILKTILIMMQMILIVLQVLLIIDHTDTEYNIDKR